MRKQFSSSFNGHNNFVNFENAFSRNPMMINQHPIERSNKINKHKKSNSQVKEFEENFLNLDDVSGNNFNFPTKIDEITQGLHIIYFYFLQTIFIKKLDHLWDRQ